MTGAKVNAKMVPFSYALATGDTVEILVSKNRAPSPDMLSMARTSIARGHIRSALRKRGYVQPKPKRGDKTRREVTLLITRESRVGLLKDITSILSSQKINITKTETDVHDPNKPYLVIQCVIPRACDFPALLVRLKRVKGVKGIEIKS